MVKSFKDILAIIDSFDPIKYTHNRNFIDGNVSKLSPYISRGVISTRFVFERLKVNYSFFELEKFLQELVWRDHWQQQWKSNRPFENINPPILQPHRKGIPISILKGETGINAIDSGIKQLIRTGYLHNHIRMYIASLICNFARCDWQTGANWMYYHLLDGDLASNHLSWQWVAGTNSKKAYVFNQNNVNKYCYTRQRETFIDRPYEGLLSEFIPDILQEVVMPQLPSPQVKEVENDFPIAASSANLYNWWNIDPQWNLSSDLKILILEPSLLEKFPISQKSMDFLVNQAKELIPSIKIYRGEFLDLKKILPHTVFHYKNHPLNKYEGIVYEQNLIAPIVEPQPSFFKYWNKVKKLVKY